mmetsp:Transcript_26845/g.60023  ORF Transcript_26845/g.60023 Transcript_26845/m.60023 type:complete len:94 (+) Transcript_26845:354-635(+)
MLMNNKEVRAGATIITEGAAAGSFYVMVEGRTQVLVKDDLAHAYDGTGAFGELALVHNAPRASTVTAVEVCVLYTPDSDTFRLAKGLGILVKA